MFPVPFGYQNQLAALVGIGDAGIVAPPAAQPWAIPPWLRGGLGGMPLPGYPTCPTPVPPSCDDITRAYQDACAVQQAQYARALAVQAKASLPTVVLPIGNTLTAGVLGTVAANTAAVFTATPSVPFCIIDMTVQRPSAPFFTINSMLAAMRNYLADGANPGMPCDSLSPDSTHPTMEFPTISPGSPLTLTVTNFDGAAHPFLASLHGIRGGDLGPCLG